MRNPLMIATTLALLAAPAMADERATCEDNIRVNGAIMRAEMMCKNQSTTGRLKATFFFKTEACRSFAKSDEGLAVINEGSKAFDNAVAQDGLAKTCKFFANPK